jgi:ribosomal protein L11 methylase PrmA
MLSDSDQDTTDHRLAPFNPTNQNAVIAALQLMKLTCDDILVDLGCGDGRLLITAVKEIAGLRCVGIEIDPVFVEKALAAVRQLNSEQQSRVDIRLQDVLDIKHGSDNADVAHDEHSYLMGAVCQDLNLEDATAVFMYLLPKGILRVKSLLEKVVDVRKQQNQKFQVVTYMFQVHGWTPAKVDRTGKANVPIYLYEFVPPSLNFHNNYES